MAPAVTIILMEDKDLIILHNKYHVHWSLMTWALIQYKDVVFLPV